MKMNKDEVKTFKEYLNLKQLSAWTIRVFWKFTIFIIISEIVYTMVITWLGILRLIIK